MVTYMWMQIAERYKVLWCIVAKKYYRCFHSI